MKIPSSFLRPILLALVLLSNAALSATAAEPIGSQPSLSFPVPARESRCDYLLFLPQGYDWLLEHRRAP